jgi:hypothetical protein
MSREFEKKLKKRKKSEEWGEMRGDGKLSARGVKAESGESEE